MRSQTHHEQTSAVTCSDTGKSSIADVLSFIPEQKLTVSIEKSIRLEMTYNPRNQLYIAHRSGLEFVSKGPAIMEVAKFKRR